MAIIDMASIASKINAYANTSQGKQAINKAIRNVSINFGARATKFSPEEAANKFVEVMLDAVRSAHGSAMGQTAVDAASNFVAGTPSFSTAANGGTVATIPFTFEGNLHRDSLAPSKYGGVDNIVALLNNGYSANRTVFGSWHGKNIASRKERAGAGFVQSAVRIFMSQYATDYNVIDIKVGDAYT